HSIILNLYLAAKLYYSKHARYCEKQKIMPSHSGTIIGNLLVNICDQLMKLNLSNEPAYQGFLKLEEFFNAHAKKIEEKRIKDEKIKQQLAEQRKKKLIALQEKEK